MGFVGLLAVAQSACGDAEPCWGFTVGTQVDAEVQEVVYNQIEGPFCATDQDLGVGDTGRFRVVGAEPLEPQETCTEPVMTIESVPSVERLGENEGSRHTLSGGPGLNGSDLARIGSCEGEWRFAIIPASLSVSAFADYDPERKRPGLRRCFFPDPTSDCDELIAAQLPPTDPNGHLPEDKRCCDWFGVQLERVGE
jgi:hypothetical protein